MSSDGSRVLWTHAVGRCQFLNEYWTTEHFERLQHFVYVLRGWPIRCWTSGESSHTSNTADANNQRERGRTPILLPMIHRGVKTFSPCFVRQTLYSHHQFDSAFSRHLGNHSFTTYLAFTYTPKSSGKASKESLGPIFRVPLEVNYSEGLLSVDFTVVGLAQNNTVYMCVVVVCCGCGCLFPRCQTLASRQKFPKPQILQTKSFRAGTADQ